MVAQRDRKGEGDSSSPSSHKANKKRSRDGKKGSASEESKQQPSLSVRSGGSVSAEDEAEPPPRKNRSVSASSARSAASRRDIVEVSPKVSSSSGLVGGEDDISSDGNTADGTLDESQDAAVLSDPAEGPEATTAGRAAGG